MVHEQTKEGEYFLCDSDPVQWPEVESLTPEQDLHPLGHLALKYILVCDHFLPKIFFTGLLSVE